LLLDGKKVLFNRLKFFPDIHIGNLNAIYDIDLL